MQREFGYSAAQLSGAFSLARLISAVAGIGVGRYLDWRGPRALMTIGSIAGVLFVLAWSRVDGLVAFYALWAGIGLLMAAVLYEPAFVVLAKWFPVRSSPRPPSCATLPSTSEGSCGPSGGPRIGFQRGRTIHGAPTSRPRLCLAR
jgi:MFS family permease